ncbi:MAG: hypothetical protein AAFN94_15030 [Pseudomonadota bacterium]
MDRPSAAQLWSKYGHFVSPLLAIGLVSASFYFGLAMGFGATFVIFLDVTFFSGELFRFGLALAIPALVLRITQLTLLWIGSVQDADTDGDAPGSQRRWSRMLTVVFSIAYVCAVTGVVFDHFLIDFAHQILLAVFVMSLLFPTVSILFLAQVRRTSPTGAFGATWGVCRDCLRHPIRMATTQPVFMAWLVVATLYLSFCLGALRVSSLASGDVVEVTLAQGGPVKAVILGTNGHGLILFEPTPQSAPQPVLADLLGPLSQVLPLQEFGGLAFVPYDAVVRVSDGDKSQFPRPLRVQRD